MNPVRIQVASLQGAASMLGIVLLSGCAAIGPAYSPAPSPAPDQSLVYIYRSNTMALGGRGADFYLDGVHVVDLRRNGYTWFHAKADRHALSQAWAPDLARTMAGVIRYVDWKPGQTYFYRFEVEGDIGVFRWRLTEIPARQAEAELADKSLQPALGADKAGVPATAKAE